MLCHPYTLWVVCYCCSELASSSPIFITLLTHLLYQCRFAAGLQRVASFLNFLIKGKLCLPSKCSPSVRVHFESLHLLHLAKPYLSNVPSQGCGNSCSTQRKSSELQPGESYSPLPTLYLMYTVVFSGQQSTPAPHPRAAPLATCSLSRPSPTPPLRLTLLRQ